MAGPIEIEAEVAMLLHEEIESAAVGEPHLGRIAFGVVAVFKVGVAIEFVEKRQQAFHRAFDAAAGLGSDFVEGRDGGHSSAGGRNACVRHGAVPCDVIQIEQCLVVLIRSSTLAATPDQIRAARAILGLSQPSVAGLAKVSTMTVKRAEGSGKPPASGEAMAAIQAALEEAGVIFVAENGEGPGVRLKK